MKQVFQKIIALLMAIVVLLSTVSFSVAKHYCGTMLVDVSLYKDAKSCGMEIPATKTSCETKTIKKSCCSDTHEMHQGQDELKFSWGHFDMDQELVITSFLYSFVNRFEDATPQSIPLRDYSPPLITQELQVLNATFLI